MKARIAIINGIQSLSRIFVCVLLIADIAMSATSRRAALDERSLTDAAKVDPIAVVVKLLTEMKSQVNEEDVEDNVWYTDFMCWCKQNIDEKTESIAKHKDKLGSLLGFLQGAAADIQAMKSKIKVVGRQQDEDEDALDEVLKIRKQEKEEFAKEEADLKETRALLLEAYEVMSKVQNKKYTDVNAARTASAALLQVGAIVKRHGGQFHAVMEEDLSGVLNALEEMERSKQKQSFLEQSDGANDEPQGKPNDLKGGAAGAKSYNSRSGVIFGVLDEMLRQVSRDLAQAQRTELEAVIDFNKVNAAKIAEIHADKKRKAKKQTQRVELKDKMAKADQDMASVLTRKAADVAFLTKMKRNCDEETKKYNDRVSLRITETSALSDALKILTADEARDLFAKTTSLFQTMSVSHISVAREHAAERAMRRIAELARQHRNWGLAALAVRVRVAKLDEVKEAIDKLVGVLKAEQREEYDKREQCIADIDKTEDNIKEAKWKQNKAEQHKTKLTNEIKNLEKDIEEVKHEIEEMKTSLKKAGEVRKEENAIFQKAIRDQKATVKVLGKVTARLEDVYGPEQTFVQTESNQQEGRASLQKPSKSKEYQKQAAGGLLGSLQIIIKSAEKTSQNLEVNEQEAQEEYEEFAGDTAAMLKAAKESIDEKDAQKSQAKSDKGETKEDLTNIGEHLDSFGKMLVDYHADCDFLLKYFEKRQQARQEEMDGLVEAKAILNGANLPR